MAQTLPFVSASPIMEGTAGYEIQRKTNFAVFLYPPGGNGRLLTLALHSVAEPKVEVGVIEVPYGNQIRKGAGKPKISPVEIVFKDYVDKDIFRVLWNWWKKVYNLKTGAIGLARDYKTNASLVKFGPNGKFLRMWKLWGFWPNNVQPGNAQHEGDNMNLITITFQVDEVEYMGALKGTISGSEPGS